MTSKTTLKLLGGGGLIRLECRLKGLIYFSHVVPTLAFSHVRQETLFTFISFLYGSWEEGERESTGRLCVTLFGWSTTAADMHMFYAHCDISLCRMAISSATSRHLNQTDYLQC
jgi:hypothetical protein